MSKILPLRGINLSFFIIFFQYKILNAVERKKSNRAQEYTFGKPKNAEMPAVYYASTILNEKVLAVE